MTNKKNPLSSDHEKIEHQESEENIVKNQEPISEYDEKSYADLQDEKKNLHVQQIAMATTLSERLKNGTSDKITLSDTLPATLKSHASEIYYYQLFDENIIDQRSMSDRLKRQIKDLFPGLKAWYIAQMKHDFPGDREMKVQKVLEGLYEKKNMPAERVNYINQTMFAEYANRLESRDVYGTDKDTQMLVRGIRQNIKDAQEYTDKGKIYPSVGYAAKDYRPRRYWLYQDRTTTQK